MNSCTLLLPEVKSVLDRLHALAESRDDAIIQQVRGPGSTWESATSVLVTKHDYTRSVADFAKGRRSHGRILLLHEKNLHTADFLATLLKACDDQWDRRDYKGNNESRGAR